MKAARGNLTAIGFLVLALFSSPLAAQGKPRVGVEFRIEAKNFQRNLFKKLDHVQASVADMLVASGNAKFGFLRWQKVTPNQRYPQLSAVLHVSLIEGEPGSVGKAIWLRFSARRENAGSTFNCMEEKLSMDRPFGNRGNLGALPLFSGSEPQPTGDPEALKRRIQRAFDANFSNDSVRQWLSDTFLSDIPLGHQADLLPPPYQNYVALGHGRYDLEVADKSRMRLKLCSIPPGAYKAAGSLELEAAVDESVFGGPFGSQLQASISSCTFQPWKDQECTQKIPLILQKRIQKPGGIEVFITRYIRRPPDTQKNLALSSKG